MAPVFVDERGDPVVGLTKHGKGAFVLVSSGWLFSNGGLTQASNLAFVTNLVTSLGGSGEGEAPAILFDEYHHGYGERDTLWTVSPWPLKAGLIQLVLAILLLTLGLSRRLKAPIPLPGLERTRAEFLTSMATLLQRAGASGVALKQADKEFRARVCGRFGLPEDAPTATLVAAVRQRRPGLATQTKTVLDRVELLIAQGRPPVEDVLATVQALHKLRKETERLL